MQVQATAKWVRVPPRKARLVANVVEGMPVGDALTALSFMTQSAAEDVAKVVRSAAANAENNFSLERDRLQLLRIEVDGGPTIKRFRPRARGASFSIFKRTCHLKAVLDDSLERPTRARGRTRPVRAASQPAPAEEEEE
ncbi:MAG TPA: 50S ribosomal protein L22 [Candidatus Dormibacteraeota bacterium]|nr:50S ribosomal protein L22 [Candidatus Dormibacteraeota bacterium]